MPWDFIWLMFILKIPLAGLCWLVWWAIKQEPEPAASGDDGRERLPRPVNPHPRRPLPRHPRRGPHGSPAALPPPRVRTVRARARSFEH